MFLNRDEPIASNFFATIHRDGDWWIGGIEGLPGVNSQGTSRADLLSHLKEAPDEFLNMGTGWVGPYRLLAPVWFVGLSTKRRALGKLAGRFSFQSRKDGPVFVPESALPYLIEQGVAFMTSDPSPCLDPF